MNPWHYIWFGIGWAILGSCALMLAAVIVTIVCGLLARVGTAIRARVRRWRKPVVRAGGGGS